MNNPLIDAVIAYDEFMDQHTSLMHLIAGCSVFEPYDEKFGDEVFELISGAWNGAYELSPRARQARLNLIWKDFLVKHPIDKKGCEDVR